MMKQEMLRIVSTEGLRPVISQSIQTRGSVLLVRAIFSEVRLMLFFV